MRGAKFIWFGSAYIYITFRRQEYYGNNNIAIEITLRAMSVKCHMKYEWKYIICNNTQDTYK